RLFIKTPKKYVTAFPTRGNEVGDNAFMVLIKILSVLYNIYPCTEKFMTTIIIYPDKIKSVAFFIALYKSLALISLFILLVKITAIITTVITSVKLYINRVVIPMV